RIDAARAGDGTDRGHAAGRSLVAAPVEHPARRSRPGARTPWSCLLPLCGRLQHLCAVAPCRRTADDVAHGLPGRASAADGQSRQECGRPSVEPDLPGLHRDGSSGATPQGRAQKRDPATGQASGCVPAGPRSIIGAHRRDSDPDPTRLDPLLPAGAGERDLRGPRRLVAAQDALHPMAPVEATAYPCPALDATWARRSACMGVRYQRTRPLAECWGQSHERCLPQVLLRPTRAAVAYGVALPSKSRRMNRRIRNRTSGGVGGGGREAYPLPDLGKRSGLNQSPPCGLPGVWILPPSACLPLKRPTLPNSCSKNPSSLPAVGVSLELSATCCASSRPSFFTSLTTPRSSNLICSTCCSTGAGLKKAVCSTFTPI